MSLLAAVVLASATARVEAVSLAAVDSHLAVRVALSGQAGMVSVHREKDAARISVAGAQLGSQFTGGQQFSWIPSGADASLLAAPSRLDRLEVVALPSEVSVLLHVPSDVAIDVRRDRGDLLLVLRPTATRENAATPGGSAEPAATAQPETTLPEPTPGLIVPRPAEPAPALAPPHAAAQLETTLPEPTPGLIAPRPAEPAPAPAPPHAAAQPETTLPEPTPGLIVPRPAEPAPALAPPHAAAQPETTLPEPTPGLMVPQAVVPTRTRAPEPAPSVATRPPPPGEPEGIPTEAASDAPHPAPAPVVSDAPAAPGALSTPEASPTTRSGRPSADVAELARSLFPGATSSAARATGQASVAELYGQLFPEGTPQTEPETVAGPGVEPVSPDQGVMAGPFRIQLGIDARYVDADTFVEASGEPVRDQYLEVAPRVAADAPVGEGHLTLSYLPVLRAFATYDDVNSSSHTFGAEFDAPLGPSIWLRAKDSFIHGLLDTRAVDPGGEYFFGLGRFNRNDAGADLSIVTGPRTSVELGGLFSTVHFTQPSTFFDYDEWRGSAGLGYALSPTLKLVTSYVYERVPTPPDRPEAEARAHSGEVRLVGDITPLLTGSLSAGYRHQTSPNAGPDGRQYSGFVMNGAITRQFSPESSFTLYLDRSTPVSAYEENGFYVSTGIQGAARVPLPLELQLQGGLGYQWNEYRTAATEIGVPREDRILALYVGLRRPIRRQFFVSATYRREERHSNVDRFDTNTDGFFLQLEWDIFGTAR